MGVQLPCRVHTKIAQNVERKARNILGHKLWARGVFVSTVGRDEEKIRAYIKNQEVADQQLDPTSEARFFMMSNPLSQNPS